MGWLTRRDSVASLERATYSPELRAPVAATQAISWYNRAHPMVPNWDAEQAFKIAYIGNAIVYRCVQIIANDIAKLPLRVGPDPTEPHNYRPDHPLARLLSSPPYGPNKRHSAHTLLAHAIASYIVAGRFGWELELGARPSRVTTNQQPEPIAIWPLTTTNLAPVPTSPSGPNDPEADKYFREFWYMTTGSEQKKVLQPSQIHYQWRPSQDDFRQPESVIQSARLDISVAVMQDRYDYAFLQNDARPAAVIVHEAFAEKAEEEKFRGGFSATHQGPDNAGKIAWASSDSDTGRPVKDSFFIQTLGLTHEEAQFAQKYERKIRSICAALGVPLSKLDASGRTFSNAEAEDNTYWNDTIWSYLSDLSSGFSIDLLPRFRFSDGLACWFDVSKVDALKQRINPSSAVVGAPTLVKSGIMTINEARADYGLPASDLPEHDTLRPLEEVYLDDSAGNEIATLMRKFPQMRNILPQYNGNGNPIPIPTRISDNNPIPLPSYNDYLTEQRKIKIIKETDTIVNALENKVERGFKNLFDQQLSATISRLTGRRGKLLIDQYPIEVRTAIDNVFDATFWKTKTSEIAHNLFEDIFVQGGLRIASKVGVSFDVKAEYVQQFIMNRANKLSSAVTDTTYTAIKNTLSEGVDAGESIAKLSARIKSVFQQASTTRATTIARTETISAFNGSSKLVAKTEGSGLIVAQEWIATFDERTRDSHAEANGQIVSLEGQFDVGGIPMDYPGDPSGPAEEIVNCRCTIAYYTADEIGSFPLSR